MSQTCIDDSACFRIGWLRSVNASVNSCHLNSKPGHSHCTVLLVDDGDQTRLLTKWFLSNFGFSVDTARNAEEALGRFDPLHHDLVITDNSMPGMTGVEMAHVIKLRSPSTPVVMYSGSVPEDQTCLDALVQRPTHLLELKAVIEKLLDTNP
jgi:CheY-like chemotaxis protein